MTTCLSWWLSEAKLWVGIIEKIIPITRQLKKNVRSSLCGLFFMARNVLLVEALRKVVPTAAGELVILDGIDLEINDGESVAIVGASGSGKTTLLGILAGLDTATSGLVKLMDSEISGMDEEARAVLRGQHVGFVFQSFQLLTSLTALENVMLPV